MAFEHIYGFIASVKKLNWYIGFIGLWNIRRECKPTYHMQYQIIFCLFCLNLMHSQPHFAIFTMHSTQKNFTFIKTAKIGTRTLKHPMSAIDPLLLTIQCRVYMSIVESICINRIVLCILNENLNLIVELVQSSSVHCACLCI